MSLRLALDLDGCVINTPPEPFGAWYRDEEGWLDQPPMLGAVDTVTELIEMGHKVTFVTARYASPVTLKWLTNYFSGLPWLTVEDCPSKWQVKADVYLDDSPNVITGLWERGLCVVKFANERNRNAPARHIVKSWDQMFDLVVHDKLDLGHRVVPHKWQRRRERAAMFGDARDVLDPNRTKQGHLA